MKTPALKVSDYRTGLFQIALLFMVLGMLYWKVQTLDLDFVSWLAAWFVALDGSQYLLLTVLIFLMPLNWSMEAGKWQALAAPVQRLSFLQSIAGVLSGLSLSFVGPNAIADYLGRIWQVQQVRRYRLLGAVLINRITQLSVTLACGLWGLMAFAERQKTGLSLSLYIVIVLSGLLLLLSIVILLLRRRIAPLLLRWGWRRLAAALRILQAYRQQTILKVWLLALLRYGVFALQFFIALRLCGVGEPAGVLMAGITWVFLIKSVVPGIQALQSLGIRELSALIFFEGISPQLTAIIWAGLLLWGINILVPATGGAFTLLRAKIKA